MAEGRESTDGSDAPRCWRFANACLDERTVELKVDGEIVRIESKPLEVLRHLLSHAGEVVTKDEILEAVWPGRVLSESVLTKAISKVREALQDHDGQIVRTQHGYGYRLVAEVTVEASSTPLPPRMGFKAGDAPAGRPQWKLVERLGTGGHGEAWLARHEKTGDHRVYKFALDAGALSSLKREITLFRLLHEALGDRARIIELQDWNLEEEPYFVEIAWAEGGSLPVWAQSQGGLAAVPLSDRLEIAAQMAEALAAAHSVGVLHKDVKPSNVLVKKVDGTPEVLLSDFGSGGVLDSHRLARMGITRMGFTQAVGSDGTTSGTPVYFAPEVMVGQPFTVRSDIYALGVVLYQLVVGDFEKAIAPGWESRIDDELLREDIAIAAHGEATLRLQDAGLLAERLRTLDQRRAKRKAERERIKAEAVAHEKLQRLRTTRAWSAAMILVLLGGIGFGAVQYRAALNARDEARAVGQFITQDLLSAANPFQGNLRDFSMRELFERVERRSAERLADQPGALGQIQFSLSAGYAFVEMFDRQRTLLVAAHEQFERAYGPDDVRTLRIRSRMAFMNAKPAPSADSPDPLLAEVSAALARHLPANHFYRLAHKNYEGYNFSYGGHIDTAVRIFEEVAATPVDWGDGRDTLLQVGDEDPPVDALWYMSTALRDATRYAEAIPAFRRTLEALPQSEVYRGEGLPYAIAHMQRGLAGSLAAIGDHEAAIPLMEIAIEQLSKHLGEASHEVLDTRSSHGWILLEAGRWDQAIAVFEAVIEDCKTLPCSKITTPKAYRRIGIVRIRQGRWQEAYAPLMTALEGFEREEFVGQATGTMVDLAKVALTMGRPDEAREFLSRLPPEEQISWTEGELTYGELWRVQGLLAARSGDLSLAQRLLRKSLRVFEERVGADHDRTRTVRDELAALRLE